MSKNQYVEINGEILHSDLYSDDKYTLLIFLYLLSNREIETNSTEIITRGLAGDLKIDEETLKKKLFRMKKLGYIELYQSEPKWKIIVAIRKKEHLYDIGDFELFLDEQLIISPSKSNSRNESGYGKFRKDVLKRDNFTCQLCGSNEKLEVHHKRPYAKYKTLRTTVSNGITLCEKCHKKIHSRRYE